MSEELGQEETEQQVAPEDVGEPQAPEEDLPEALREIDPEQMKKLKEKLAAFTQSKKQTISGSEDPDADDGQPRGEVMSGKDVDWNEYDLEYSVRHLYRTAMFRETPQGPKWVAMVDEFYSTERAFGSHGKKIQQDSEFLNIGEYLNDMLNSPEGWTLLSVLPSSTGRAGLLFRRQVPVVLPDPKPLKKATEVEPPTDRELDTVENAATDFMAQEGLDPVGAGPSAPTIE